MRASSMEVDKATKEPTQPWRYACEGIALRWRSQAILTSCFRPNRAVKQIVAVVKPYLAERVLEGLRRAPLEALWVHEVKGVGKQKSYLDQYADTEDGALDFLPKVELAMVVDDTRAEEVLERLVEIARTGRMGDGKIFVLPATPSDAAVG